MMKKWLFWVSCVVLASCVSSKKVENSSAKSAGESLNFIVLGDWGKKGWHHQKSVAKELAKSAKAINADFFITTGDNFYYSGVTSVNDRHWQLSYERIYTAPALQKKWYPVLGNHDYRGNVNAQIDYSKISSRWHMPARYYSEKFFINGDSTQQVLILFLDTNPFVKDYYTDDSYRQSIHTEDSTKQKEWLQEVLSNPSPNIKWKIVVGHHPLTTGGSRIHAEDVKELNGSLKPLFEKHKVDAYIAGHDHHLEHTKPEGFTHFFISGGGAARKPAILNPNGGLKSISDQGFMTFSVLPDKLSVQVINNDGAVLYTTEIKK